MICTRRMRLTDELSGRHGPVFGDPSLKHPFHSVPEGSPNTGLARISPCEMRAKVSFHCSDLLDCSVSYLRMWTGFNHRRSLRVRSCGRCAVGRPVESETTVSKSSPSFNHPDGGLCRSPEAVP